MPRTHSYIIYTRDGCVLKSFDGTNNSLKKKLYKRQNISLRI